MKRLFIAVSAFLIGIFSLASLPTPVAITVSKVSANWPQWRGPDGQGISTEKGLPTEWSMTKNVKWKTPIEGRGHSSPVVWGNRIFLTTAIEGDIIPDAKPPKHKLGDGEYVHPDSVGANRSHTLKVLCFNRRSGKLLWEQTAYSGRVYDDRHRKATYADGTPVTDGRHIYAWFDSEGLYCYDFGGKLVWKRSLGPIATQGMGNGTSPVLYQNLVILQCDEDNGEKSFIVAFDKRNGKEIWRTPRQPSPTKPFSSAPRSIFIALPMEATNEITRRLTRNYLVVVVSANGAGHCPGKTGLSEDRQISAHGQLPWRDCR